MASKHELPVRLICKKVKSGKCQVRFQVKLAHEKQIYGYFLTSPDEKLKDVINRLRCRLAILEQSNDPFHMHLYTIGRNTTHLNDIIIFQSKTH